MFVFFKRKANESEMTPEKIENLEDFLLKSNSHPFLPLHRLLLQAYPKGMRRKERTLTGKKVTLLIKSEKRGTVTVYLNAKCVCSFRRIKRHFLWYGTLSHAEKVWVLQKVKNVDEELFQKIKQKRIIV